jgi:hypothetical protein
MLYRIARANRSAGKTKPKQVASSSHQKNPFAPPRLNNPSAATWAKGWNRWSHYCKQHGTHNVPENYKDKELVQWVQEQRVNYALWKRDPSTTFLTKAAWDLLENMGFDFGSTKSKKRKSKTNSDDADDSEERSAMSLAVKRPTTATTTKSSPAKRKREHNSATKQRFSKSKKKHVLTLESSSDDLEESGVDSHTEGVAASSVEGA